MLCGVEGVASGSEWAMPAWRRFLGGLPFWKCGMTLLLLEVLVSGASEAVTGLSSEDRWYSIDEVRWSRSGIQMLVLM